MPQSLLLGTLIVSILSSPLRYFPDDGSPVCPLEVAPHDLVEPAVGEDEALELEAARPQQVHRLLVLVREPQRVVVPSAGNVTIFKRVI